MPDLLDRLKTALADRYAIERELGEGGMATVYLAEDLKHHRKVAVKVLRPELAAAIGPERFLREIEIAANLTHPHILPLHDSGEADGFLFYVMPYIEGETLRDRLVRYKQLAVDDATEITRQVARALGYAHDRNVLHRDIKPENILLAEGEAVVADFGIAKAIHAAGGEQLTETGMSVGTPTYMSPEQASGSRDLDGRSDIYGLGCVLYEMLAGQAPFTGPTVESIVHQHLTADVPSVTVIREAVPREVADVIRRAMAKTPADRFATASEFADALKPVGVTPATGSIARAAPPRQRRIGLVAAALVALAAVAWGITRTGGSAGGDSDIPRLVVLPFENLGSPDDEFFADGMTEEITSRLANIRGLRVIARQSAIQYKGSTLSSREIAEELNVDYVLEGTVRTDRVEGGSGQVRITPQLIRTSDDTHVWAQASTVALVPGQIFSVQADVAEQVARALNVVLSDAEHESIDVRPTEDLEAYELYLRGNIHFARRTNEEDAREAVEYYQRAADVDPRFVDALAALSKARVWLQWDFALQEELAKARVVLDSARALAPDGDAVNIAAAYYHYYGERDYTAALEQLQRVEARQPSNADVPFITGAILRRQGEWESATARLQRAFDLNPKDPIAALALGETYGVRGQFAAAVRYLDQAIALTPSVWSGHLFKAWVFVHEDRGTARAWEVVRAAAEQVIHPGLLRLRANLHRLDRDYGAAAAIAEVAPPFETVAGERWEMHYLAGQDALARTWADSARRVHESTLRSRPNYGTHARIGAVYAVLGRTADAIRETERAKELLPMTVDAVDGTKVVWTAARTYLLVGQVEDAIDHLETLAAAPFRLGIPPLELDPIWDPIRDHHRFQALLAKYKN